MSPRTPTPALSRNRSMTLLTATGRAEIRSIGTSSSLCSGFCASSLEVLHLVVELGSKLFVLLCELANAVLRNPIIPTTVRHTIRLILNALKWRTHVVDVLDKGFEVWGTTLLKRMPRRCHAGRCRLAGLLYNMESYQQVLSHLGRDSGLRVPISYGTCTHWKPN